MALDVEVFFFSFFLFFLLLFVVVAMVGGCGGFDMGGWWPVVLGCERETEERETEKERGRIKKE